MSLEALFNAVIVKPIEVEETTHGNIIVPDLGKEKNETGEIVSIGPGQPTLTGDFIPTILSVGDIVVLPTQGFTKLPFDGIDYYVGPENQVLAKVVAESNLEDLLEDTKENLTEQDIKNIINE